MYQANAIDKHMWYWVSSPIENTLHIQFNLNQTIHGDALLKAVQMVQKRYLSMQQKLVLIEDQIQFEENPKPIEIYQTAKKHKMIVGAPTHDYPWAISYFDNVIVFTGAHGLFDGKATLEILKSITYYYLEQVGIQIKDRSWVRTLLDDVEKARLEEELDLDTFCDKTVQANPTKQCSLPDQIEERFLKPADSIAENFRITVQADTLMPLLKKYQTTPFALMVPIIARSLKYLFDKENPIINAAVVTDFRALFGVDTLHNLGCLEFLSYISDEMDKMSYEGVSTIFRSTLDSKLTKENVIANFTQLVGMVDEFGKIRPFSKRRTMYASMGSDQPPMFQYFFSNVGRVLFPEEMQPYVTDISFQLPCCFPAMFSVLGYQDKVSFFINSRLTDNSFLDNMMKMLDELGIKYTFEESGEFAGCSYQHYDNTF